VARGSGRAERGQRNHFVLMLLVLAAIGVLAAAGSGLESGDDTSGAPGGSGRGRDVRTLSVAFASRPRSLDPAYATDRTSANLVLALMEPLVRLGPALEIEPALARRWTVSEDGRRITFTLRNDRIWTNGEPVTAGDVEFAWKRLLSATTDSSLASPLLVLEGAPAYHACEFACGRLQERVGVRAADAQTLVVTLDRPEPWFVRSTGLAQLVPVFRPAVLGEGSDWTEAGRLVSNGPFVLGGLNERGVSLVRNARFGPPGAARIPRVEGRFVRDAAARVQAFDAGAVEALDGSPLPETDLPALRERREYEAYASLETHLYAFNFTGIPDVHQRRAMALAVDREGLAENATRGGEAPAERFTPEGAPTQGRVAPDSRWLPPGGDMGAARDELDEAAVVNRKLTLLHVDRPGAGDVAAFLQSAWRGLGIDTTIRSQSADDYLDFRGPLTPQSVDLYEIVLDPPVPDAWPSLAAWGCRAPTNKTNFCNGRYDRLLAESRRELDPVVRNDLMVRAQEVLGGRAGLMPALPLVWPVYTNLESLGVKDTFAINPLGQIDLAAVAAG
jgi:oligopeptide transport system substrate-binding protein